MANPATFKDVISAAMEAGAPVVLTARAIETLTALCGDTKSAIEWLSAEATLGEDGQLIINGRVLNQIIGDMLTKKIIRAVELTIREHARAVVTILSDKSEGL
jgi:hypothetical protein